MTDVSTDHPYGIPYIELVEQGRKISFQRDCLGEVKIYRKVNEEDWNLLIQQTRTPYVDTEEFPSGTKISYKIELEQNHEKHQYTLEVRL